MIVRMGLLTRRPDVPVDAFRRHWRDVHGPLAAEFPGLRAYHQNHVVDRRHLAIDHKGGQWDIDGISELWFDDEAAMRAAIASPAYRPIVEDSPEFLSDTRVLVARQTTVVPPADGPLIKRMSLLKRRPDISAERFAHEWQVIHAPLIAAFPGIAGYRQNLVVDREGVPGASSPYEAVPVDGVVELWFRSEADLVAAFRSPAADRSQAQALDFIDEITPFLVEVHHVV
ncbi:EthD family reductase [Phreatobacter aquaticus]|uniref:EthD family reductase n=2 Tax=Phreatobacter aquaticus TaxID=2570229 RepID=A0A4D7QJ56_9HYPH|nr:EthD family reductase [Phreatobacter aquaticus]